MHSPADPFATAMLVVDDRVAWVGSDAAARSHSDGVDKVVDLDGRLVTPAFVDAHAHLTDTGLAATSLDLRHARSLADCLDRVAQWVRADPGSPVLGHGWDEDTWPERRAPTRQELDRAAGGAAVYLSRVDAHSAAVSSALAAAAGLDMPTSIEPGSSGEETLRGSANVTARLFLRRRINPDRRRRLQVDALRRLAALGVAAVHEMAGPDLGGIGDVAALRDVQAGRDDLPDVVVYWAEPGACGVRRAAQLGASGAGGDLCLDGALGSRTALLREPYRDAPSTRGVQHMSLEAAREHVVLATRAGLQAGFHCIGDAAVALAVEAIAAAARVVGAEAIVASRHRLEHAEMLGEELTRPLAELGVCVSVQPGFDEEWGGPDGMYARRLGRARARGLNPYASLARAGVTLAFGSDSPVTDVVGWAAVRAAAHHLHPPSRLSVRAAFAAHTRGGWRAARRDDAGVLAPGALASYAVWDIDRDDLLVQAPDERLAAWSTDPRAGVPGLPLLQPGRPLPACLLTVAGGRVVFDVGAGLTGRRVDG